MTIFAEITPAGAGQPIRVCSSDTRAATSWSGQRWIPAIEQMGSIGMTLFEADFTTALEPGSTSLTIATSLLTDITPALIDTRWQNSAVQIWTETFGPIVGEVDRFESGASTVKLTIKIKVAAGDTKVLASEYAGTGGKEGSADKKGQVKPWLFGLATNAEPVPIDEDNSVYQFSAYGPIKSVVALYEKGSDFGPSIGNFATYAALVAATIPAGSWGTCLAEGMIRLGAPQAGIITGDVEGDYTGATFRRLTGAILQYIASYRGILSSTINAASMAAIDAYAATLPNGGKINLYLTEQTTFVDLARRLALGLNAQAGYALDGRLILTRVDLTGATITLHERGRRVPLVTDMFEGDTLPPYRRIVMGGARVWRVHNYQEIAFLGIPVDRGDYVPAETYREGDIVQLPDGSRWIYVNPVATSGNTPALGSSYWSSLSIAVSPTSQDPTPPVTMIDGGLYIRPSDNRQFRFVGRELLFGGAQVTFNGVDVLGSGYRDVQDVGVPAAQAAADTAQSDADAAAIAAYNAAVAAAAADAAALAAQGDADAAAAAAVAAQVDADAAAAAAVAAQGDVDALAARVDAIDDDDVLSISEKVEVLIPAAAALEALWQTVSATATTAAVSTATASAARTAWLAYLAGISPAWNSIAAPSPITRGALDTARNDYDAALKLLNRQAIEAMTAARTPDLTGNLAWAISGDAVGAVISPLPADRRFSAFLGTVDVSPTTDFALSSISPSLALTVNNTAASADRGVVTMGTGTTGSGTALLTATLPGGAVVQRVIAVTKTNAIPPAAGGSGSTFAQDTSFTSINSGSHAAISDELVVRSDASGNVRVAIDLAYQASGGTAARTPSFKAAYATSSGGSLTDLFAEGGGSSCIGGTEPEEGAYVRAEATIAMPAASTDYYFKLLGRRSSGTGIIAFIGNNFTVRQ